MIRFHTRIALGVLAILGTLLLQPGETSAATQLTAIDFNVIGDLGTGELVRTGRLEQTPGDPYLLTGTMQQTYSTTSSGGWTDDAELSVALSVRVQPPLGTITVVNAAGTGTQSVTEYDDGLCPRARSIWNFTFTGGRYTQPASSEKGNLELTGTVTLTDTRYGAKVDTVGNPTGECVTYLTESTSTGRLATFQGIHVFGSNVSVSIGDAVELEGGPDSSNQLSFPVTLSGPAPLGGLSVSFGTSDASANAGSDYQFTAGGLFFAQGETAKTVLVPIAGDSQTEPDETIVVTLANPSGGTIADGTGTGTILNDDAVVQFDWTMPARFGLDANSNSLIDYFTTAAAISPSRWRVDFTYTNGGSCDPSASPTIKIDGATVSISDPNILAWNAATCSVSYGFPSEKKYAITFELSGPGGSVLGQATRDVTVQDFLIVSLGDSVASGEGNPDIPGTPVWQNEQCHRSASAGPAQAALAIEQADPKTSVTFVHLACSGASVWQGVLGRYRGIEGGPWIPPQVDTMDSLVGTREIDAVTLSAGANDLRFGTILTGCFIQLNCHLLTTSNSMRQLFESALVGLPGNYNSLANSLNLPPHNVAANRIYITEYFDPMRNQTGNFCDQYILEESGNVPFLGISGAESNWASTEMIVKMNQEVAAAASRHGWKYVGGIASAFQPHGYCSNDRWIVRLSDSRANQADVLGTLHPNGPGHAYYSGKIAASLTADLYVGGDLSQPRAPR